MDNNLKYSDRMPTLLKRSNLPMGLRKVNPEFLKPSIRSICENMKAFKTGSIYLYGPGRGKSTSAAALMLNYLNLYRYNYTTDDIGYYISGYDLCRFNRTMNRYNEDDAAYYNKVMYQVKHAKCLIVDNIFDYMTQTDELLFNAIYDSRQYCDGLTIYTTIAIEPLQCAGTTLYRIARDAKHKEQFLC